jgi:hypothetical protein
MPVGMFRSEEGWVQVDYGTGSSSAAAFPVLMTDAS